METGNTPAINPFSYNSFAEFSPIIYIKYADIEGRPMTTNNGHRVNSSLGTLIAYEESAPKNTNEPPIPTTYTTLWIGVNTLIDFCKICGRKTASNPIIFRGAKLISLSMTVWLLEIDQEYMRKCESIKILENVVNFDSKLSLSLELLAIKYARVPDIITQVAV